ncbi:branched-chain-amino-acid aminotransferase 5, chloroplastic-like isoform X2 [Iris pallida]|uniref:Branched-chain-amino-acid aminotransferase n=1 Tax=Iris pallida TaxID=29817 RepID=A0AAX6IGS4_IRIPA|nr:branched-chain-amino-acid aminotransferase 5, chloroplastic-like isoform X2 [Iris pallida]
MLRLLGRGKLSSILTELVSSSRRPVLSRLGGWATSFSSYSSASSSLQPLWADDEYADVNWDELGFSVVPTDYMYVMKCARDDTFSSGRLNPYGNIELNPSSGVLNYGQVTSDHSMFIPVRLIHSSTLICTNLLLRTVQQGVFEGLKAYRKLDGCGFMLFRPVENATRMQMGADRMCMPSPSADQFIDAVKETVLANRRWVPPQGKGSLYIRPLLIGSGPVLGLAPAPEYTFLVYAAPVGNYFKAREGMAPINLVVEDEVHRATPGGTGGVKTITNYAPVLKAQLLAKHNGFTDILYVDPVKKKYLEEASSSNIFIIKGNVISTPATQGTILAGITRRSIIEIARDSGYMVLERLVAIEDLIDADEVFCTGTAVVVSPVGSVTYHGQRFEYRTGAETVSQRLYKSLTDIQMGLAEDTKGWTVEVA